MTFDYIKDGFIYIDLAVVFLMIIVTYFQVTALRKKTRDKKLTLYLILCHLYYLLLMISPTNQGSLATVITMKILILLSCIVVSIFYTRRKKLILA